MTEKERTKERRRRKEKNLREREGREEFWNAVNFGHIGSKEAETTGVWVCPAEQTSSKEPTSLCRQSV